VSLKREHEPSQQRLRHGCLGLSDFQQQPLGSCKVVGVTIPMLQFGEPSKRLR